MSLAIDNPIINSSFDKPTRYWEYKEGQPMLVENRRPAGYYLKPRTRELRVSLFELEKRVQIVETLFLDSSSH